MVTGPSFGTPPQPMTPERARYIGRAHITLADAYRRAAMPDQAQREEHQARTWIAYATSLATDPPEEDAAG
jgi:hypothetical protein